MLTQFYKYTLFILITINCSLIEHCVYADESFEFDQVILPVRPPQQMNFNPFRSLRGLSLMVVNYYLGLIRQNPEDLLNEDLIPTTHRHSILNRLNEQQLTLLAQHSVQLRQLVLEYTTSRHR